MIVPVVWLNYHQDTVLTHGMWDQGVIESLFTGELWRTPLTFVYHETIHGVLPGEGAIVVIAGRFHAHDVERINADIERLAWCLLVITSDEEAIFPWHEVVHPRLSVWVQTPHVGVHDKLSYFLPVGWPPVAPRMLHGFRALAQERPLDWFFSGQVTHARRHQCSGALRRLPRGIRGQLLETPGFTRGLQPLSYYEHLAAAKLAPCPGGPETPDTFRLWEALEAGCLPIVDAHAGNRRGEGFWELMLGETPPFPIVGDWDDSIEIIKRELERWPANATRASAWWQGYKRRLALDVARDVQDLSGIEPQRDATADAITVLIPTSPIRSHPNTAIIQETIASIRSHNALADCEIIIMCDGVREEQEKYRDAYERYLRKLVWMCEHEWPMTLPLVFDAHLHQATMTRRALEIVQTPFVLFVEHDTPLVGPEPPWEAFTRAIDSGDVNLIRLHHESQIPDEHRHLMVDRKPLRTGDVPLLRTAQWSQRPHLASTSFYRDIIRTYFGPNARTMIEDVMHGVVDWQWRERREFGWAEFKLAIYAPDGSIQRSTHTDGRGGDPKYEMMLDGSGPYGMPTEEDACGSA